MVHESLPNLNFLITSQNEEKPQRVNIDLNTFQNPVYLPCESPASLFLDTPFPNLSIFSSFLVDQKKKKKNRTNGDFLLNIWLSTVY